MRMIKFSPDKREKKVAGIVIKAITFIACNRTVWKASQSLRKARADISGRITVPTETAKMPNKSSCKRKEYCKLEAIPRPAEVASEVETKSFI